ncbi:exodeoxyribonuclease III [Kwoniella newhampshirensis]|uniref:DNA-(apurinic or apyrimidinic site) endonuclease n=1 Tax=Kwoniella newhampshirensis TaxID=1651941 RepID=A0AAW0YL10_9TREE
MRLLTWNVNVLRTCLDYHPFSSMKKKNVEGLLDELHADIFCFQEHKTVRSRLEKSMACPGPYDGFWTFPRSKTGYSGVCTYVDSRYCVPLKAEEGITGLLLDDAKGSTMKPPWTPEERIGQYPEFEEMIWMDEVDGTSFDPKRLDMEGRAVVCDFGLFILFNLYCPNETNDTRRPYKMNFLQALQERVRLLQAAGREVIIAGDINIMRAPIDSGEGGIRTSAEQHYEHPARRIMDNWCAPKGPMVDVVRESWPDRDDMFTCWNQKLDARPSNYGSRIDMILCTPGLRPWIKGGDILTKVFGSDHCPVYIDLHESIEVPGHGTLHLRDMLNPLDRTPSTAPVYPNDVPRSAPEPPRFATKFFDEFSGKQTTLKSFFGGGGAGKKARAGDEVVAPSPSPTPTPVPTETTKEDTPAPLDIIPSPMAPSSPDQSIATPFSLARAAFNAMDEPAQAASPNSDKITFPNGEASASSTRQTSRDTAIDMSVDDDPTPSIIKPKIIKPRNDSKTKTLSSSAKSATGSQTKLSSFFAQPPSKAKRKTPPLPSPSSSQSATKPKRPSLASISSSPSRSPSTTTVVRHSPPPSFTDSQAEAKSLTVEEDQLISQAIAEADAAKEAKKAEAAPIWSNLFAKKLPPLCAVHHKPCKDFIVMKPGPNKGKRFWLCSLPVGAGYDMGRSKRAREDVNPNFRCDFFLWDSANSRKESTYGGKEG